MSILRNYLIAIFLGLVTTSVPSPSDVVYAKETKAAANKAKKGKATKAVKGKAAAKGKGASKKAAKGTKDTKVTKDTKATKATKDAKATKATTAPKKTVKTNAVTKPVAPVAAATTTPPTEDQHLNAELQSYEDEQSGPWLFFFVAFIVASVGLLFYLRKKRLAGAAAQGGSDLQHSKPETAFGSALSSLDLDKNKTTSTAQPLSTQPPKSRVG